MVVVMVVVIQPVQHEGYIFTRVKRFDWILVLFLISADFHVFCENFPIPHGDRVGQ